MNTRSRCIPLMFALTGALAVALAGCDRTPVVPLPSSEALSKDGMLVASVRSALLADPALKSATELDVTANAGNVRLRGAAVDDAQFDRASEVARKVTGVTSVENNLTRPGTPTKASDNPDDIELTTAVTTALRNDPTVKSLDITVDSRKGDVQLTGSVGTRDQIDHAVEIARGVTGVHSVHDELIIAKQ